MRWNSFTPSFITHGRLDPLGVTPDYNLLWLLAAELGQALLARLEAAFRRRFGLPMRMRPLSAAVPEKNLRRVIMVWII